MKKPYIYLVTNDWATNGTEDGVTTKAFSTRQKAKKYVQEQFSSDKENYSDEDNVIIEESKDESSIYLLDDYEGNHSLYRIVRLLVE